MENYGDYFSSHNIVFSYDNNLFVDVTILLSDSSRNQSDQCKEPLWKYFLWFVWLTRRNKKTTELFLNFSFVLFIRFIGKTTRFIRLGDQIKESIDAQSSTQLQFYIERSISVQFNFTAQRRGNFGKRTSRLSSLEMMRLACLSCRSETNYCSLYYLVSYSCQTWANSDALW